MDLLNETVLFKTKTTLFNLLIRETPQFLCYEKMRNMTYVAYKNAFFREMQVCSRCYTVVSYQALFRLSVYKIPAVYLSGANKVCFCTKRDFGSLTIYCDFWTVFHGIECVEKHSGIRLFFMCVHFLIVYYAICSDTFDNTTILKVTCKIYALTIGYSWADMWTPISAKICCLISLGCWYIHKFCPLFKKLFVRSMYVFLKTLGFLPDIW